MLESIGRKGDRYLTREGLEDWLSQLLAIRGERAVNDIRDNARAIAGTLGRQEAFATLDRIIGAALATRPSDELRTPTLLAHAAGSPFDDRRAQAFKELAQTLVDTAPRTIPDLPSDQSRRVLLPFYEAYFSNYIEGTRFTLDEAEEIILGGRIPEGRPEDAHDVIGTYRIVADRAEMARVPVNADQLVELLQARHAVIMAGRPDKRPGQFKVRSNQAGASLFVAPEYVLGTLRAGFEAAAGLSSALSRAVYMMFLVSEVHPFDDGNGRIARVMMNAELVAQREVRIIIPTVFRDNYLAGLKGATSNQAFGALTDILAFAQRYTARVDFTSRQTAESDLTRTNALLDPREAEDAGRRLQLP